LLILIEPLGESFHLAILEAGGAGDLAGVLIIEYFRFGREQVGYAVQRDNRFGNESIGCCDYDQCVTLLSVLINQGLCFR
jgi:hypothetical protein